MICMATHKQLRCAEALAHHWLAVSTVLLALLPIPYLFTGYSPVVAPAMWEFTLVCWLVLLLMTQTSGLSCSVLDQHPL